MQDITSSTVESPAWALTRRYPKKKPHFRRQFDTDRIKIEQRLNGLNEIRMKISSK